MKSPLIIEQPDLQNLLQKYGWGSVTLVFWLLYFYLWLPLLTFLAWLISAKIFHLHIIELNGYQSLLALLKYYLTVIAILGIAVISWAKIECYRFARKTQRKAPRAISIDDVASYYQVSALTLASLRGASIVNVHFDENGSISHFSNPMELAMVT